VICSLHTALRKHINLDTLYTSGATLWTEQVTQFVLQVHFSRARKIKLDCILIQIQLSLGGLEVSIEVVIEDMEH